MKLRNKKTGEIVDFQPFRFYQTDSCKFPSEIYESLSALNEEWEDYKPKDPLIKDEEVRKAVRVWAEANSILKHNYGCEDMDVVFDSVEHCFTWIDTSIQFNEITGLEELEDGKKYTIEELCG